MSVFNSFQRFLEDRYRHHNGLDDMGYTVRYIDDFVEGVEDAIGQSVLTQGFDA
ncbi:MAG TPA: hypothetical protein VGI22_18225 [Xanthobacteraceae bacterium]|jgi:hypothetical protein